ncbi:Putative glucose-6-phosphate 1-epimerase [Stenotrophomonas lactitubi]|nr:Putative glucose-6-phosphate 1-epimerase [Stenotrophomonas lactitubi]CAH0281774.1 Putative glucose-6-phosphate 1-epimerase [Stenotrophomonas lactitubi]CAH0283416.1 Putative glucose-6-phosphate 1-epimerase [Stenotrophomonas lactitubi]CAH0283726.1 Putative glucose-6-phosphate 1-epimerase [Stenotrophomonas lactitubi]
MPILTTLGLAAALAMPAAAPPTAAATADPAFARCMAGLQTTAASQGIAADRFMAITAGLQPDPSVLPLLDAQPEFTTPIWDYLAALVDRQRVDDGRAMLQQHRDLLQRVSAQYGVDPVTIVAVWGVESDYGRVFGKRPLLQSLATLSCAGRRQPFFRGELLALVKLIDKGDLQAQGLTGSWAGAFGHTQFMPSTYARIAVDGDGDGRRDLVGSIPDALASTANYLKRAGWRTGEPWGMEVRVPAGFNASQTGRTQRRALADWRALGVTGLDGSALAPAGLPADARAALLLPAGNKGPALLVFRNYDAIYSYNAAESYALAIATLADRLRGGNGLVTAWPTDDPGLGRDERRQLQTLLLARGHDIGAADGMIGTASRRAIQVEQRRLGWADADGRAGQRILRALQSEPQAKVPATPTRFSLPTNYSAVQSPAIRSRSSVQQIKGVSSGQFQGLDAWLVETPQATAAISVFGGQLLSFVPKGQPDVMWLSPKRAALPTPIRGGSPVCWPYFGRQGQGDDVPAHGFVRTLPWELQQARRLDDGSIELTLAPPALDNLGLRLTMTVRVGRELRQQLLTENTGKAPATITQALHNYFRVGDASKVDVDGVDGLDYLDKFENYAQPRRQQGPWSLRDPRDPGRSDRIYTQAGGHYVLRDPVLKRRIDIRTEGSRSLVAWNPGADAAAKMADVGDGWRDYVCLEAANAGPDVITVAPGGRHTLVQTLSSASL